MKLGTDCGTENGVMAAMQCTFQQDAEAHKYGSSPVNQRIEGWWVFYRRNSFCKTRRKWLEHKKRASVFKPLLNPYSQDLTINCPYCLPFSSCGVSFENLVLYQIIIH